MSETQPHRKQTVCRERRYAARIDVDGVRKGEIVRRDSETGKCDVVAGMLSPRHVRFITEETYRKVVQAFYPPGFLENASKWLDKA